MNPVLPDGATARPTLVLASASPRRRELLAALAVRSEVRPVEVDEDVRPGEAPSAYVDRLARAKARARSESGELVLAADTAVVVGGEILGKPADHHDARRMLRRLSGRDHTVLTAVALHDQDHGREAAGVESTRVSFASMSEDEIAWYSGTEEPLDKAGAYAVQGLGGLFVSQLEGNYSNVVGLPLPLVYRLFRRLGYDFRHWMELEAPP